MERPHDDMILADFARLPVPPVPRAVAPPRAPKRRTVDKYPRLACYPEELVPDRQFHGIRVVKNPLLNAGKWDSMRAICGFHGPRCEVSRALTGNPHRLSQGRPLGLLWAWLDMASEFDGEDAAKSHQAASDPRTWPAHRCRDFECRRKARADALSAVSELPVEQQTFWLTAERPQRPGEPEEPEVCP